MIYSFRTNYFIFKNNVINNCFGFNEGGLFWIQNDNLFELENSSFTNGGSKKAGVCMLSGTNNTLQGILIIANKKYIIYIGKDLKFTNF